MLALPARPRARHARLAGARRAEQVPGLRAPGGRRPRARARALARRARPRAARAGRRGVAAARRGRARGRALRLRRRSTRAAPAGASLPHSHSQLVWLRRRAAGRPAPSAGSSLPALRLPPARARRGHPRGRAARRARPALPLRRPRCPTSAWSRRSSTRPTASAPRLGSGARAGRRGAAPAGRGRAAADEPLAARVRPLAPRAAAAADRLRRARARRRLLRQHDPARAGGRSSSGASAARPRGWSRGSGGRPRSQHPGSGPCPSPA